MKIKTKEMGYSQVVKLKKRTHKTPKRPWWLFRKLIPLLGRKEIKDCGVEYIEEGMDALGKEPCLILMNHSSFLDLKIAFTYFKKRVFNIVATTDGFVGKEWLMRRLGCIPTDKFQPDLTLIKDIEYAIKHNRSVLMYPEAGYSFDGTATTLPDSLGKFIKYLKAPVVTVITSGVFLHDPLYNNLQLRKTKVTVKVNYLLTPEDCKEKSAEELNAIMRETFSFDGFKEQQESGALVREPFRAEGLHRLLYKCPHCMAEKMISTLLTVECPKCGAKYTLTERGTLEGENAKFTHIPDWYAWERTEVKKEIEEGRYALDIPVKIGVLADFKAIYMVGAGRLKHDKEGFKLTGEDGLFYEQKPAKSYTLNADYFWYELGDIISIGNKDYLYYCFPQVSCPVTKARLATEELYKMAKGR